MPEPVDYHKAKAITDQVRKDMPHLPKTKAGVEAVRREAARRCGLDYDTFNMIRARRLSSAVPGRALKAMEDAVKAERPLAVAEGAVPSVGGAAEWTTLREDIAQVIPRTLSNPTGEGIGPMPLAGQAKPSWQAQKAWMAGANDGYNPFNPQIRRGMGDVLGREDLVFMPDKWPIDPRKAPTEQMETDWGESFIGAINKQKETQPPLWRGMSRDSDPNLSPGDEWEMLPSSWSAHPEPARAYGDVMFAVRDAYGVTLNEGRLKLADREVVAGGHFRVVGVHEFEYDTRRESPWAGEPPTIEHHKVKVYELEQLRRLPKGAFE